MTDEAGAGEQRKVGELIDSLGVTRSVEEGDLVTDAVVIFKVVDDEGRVRLSICRSEGMSWIERIGMLRAAERTDLPPEGGGWNDDD